MFKKIAVGWAIVWKVWKNRKQIRGVIEEATDVAEDVKEALSDKKITKDELLIILRSINELNESFIILLGGI